MTTTTQLRETAAPSQKAGPRLCMPTARGFTTRAFQCGYYEAQDVLRDTADLDLLRLEPGPSFRWKERWQRRLLYRDVSKRLIYRNPGLQPIRLNGEYDAFIAICPTYWDYLYVNAIEDWKDQCKTSILWIDEIWAAELPLFKHWIHSLRRFDHVFVGYRGTAGPLSEIIGKKCHWMPGAVDTLRFNPYPDPPARSIDVYSIGRRWEGIHRSLLEAARRKEIHYVYDTFPAIAEMHVYDPRQHREMYANNAKRSRYFMVAQGKMDAPEETCGQVEVGYRYYEGGASGAVLVGQAPNCEAFRELFPWDDVVVRVAPDGSDMLAVLAKFAAEPDRVAAIRRKNVAQTLLRHDWVYRWKEMLRVAGLEPSPGMVDRERRLKELADMAQSA